MVVYKVPSNYIEVCRLSKSIECLGLRYANVLSLKLNIFNRYGSTPCAYLSSLDESGGCFTNGYNSGKYLYVNEMVISLYQIIKLCTIDTKI